MVLMNIFKFCLNAWIIWTLINSSTTLQQWWFALSSFLMLLPVTYFIISFQKHILSTEVSSNGKAVLITGCGAGFGLMLAKKLHAKGFHVFAGCRSLSGQGPKTLKEMFSSRMHILSLDITKEVDVQEAVKYVQKNLEGIELWALVNNAGVYKGSYVEFTSMEEYQDIININTIGTIRVTKAFLPLLKRFKGRIITILGSPGNLSVPSSSASSMSKHALGCFCDCLRQEMYQWGMKVVTIEPEIFKTTLVESERFVKRWEKCVSQTDQSIKDSYGLSFINNMKHIYPAVLSFASNRVDIAIGRIEAAVCLQNPAYVYRPCRNRFVWFLFYVIEHFPKPILDEIMRIVWIYALKIPVPGKGLRSHQ